jgi:uncharacterized membrane protein (DUF485 family)
MAHGPATEWKKEKSEGFKSRLGLIMFAIYCVIYFAFIFIAVLNPKMLGSDVGKLNLAITYGFALIIIAIVQALIYNYMCSKREKADAEAEKGKGEGD